MIGDSGLLDASQEDEPRMEITRASFEVHGFDADAFGHLAPAALAGYLQEAATRSADALGCGRADLNRRGLTWVLAQEQVVLDQPLRLGDTIEIETWHSGVAGPAALRDFRLLRDGEEVGRAFTSRAALDLATRRPVRLQQVLPGELHAETAHLLPAAPRRLPHLGAAVIERRFQVRFADIDANLHVTNASYLGWALEAVDEPAWRARRLAAFDIRFLVECKMGTFVRSRSAPEGQGTLLHSIVREEDGLELARARTAWVPRLS
jgi:acyl-CoA thioesterase FadM